MYQWSLMVRVRRLTRYTPLPKRSPKSAHFPSSGSVGTPGGVKGGGTPPAPPPAPHAAKEMVLLSSVTAAFRAKALPVRFAPAFIVMAVSARMLPTNVVLVSRVAELSS
jgi:hypothetical protein